MRRFALVTASAAAALLIVEACSDSVSESLVDAGSMLVDAGFTEAGQMLTEAGVDMSDMRSTVEAQIAAGFKSGSRIQIRTTLHAGPDGSQVSSLPEPYDTTMQTPCTLLAAIDGKLRCLPPPNGLSPGYFADAGCSQALATEAVCWGLPAPTYFTRSEAGGSCADPLRYNYRYRVFRLGAEHTGTVYGGTPQSCTATTRGAGYRYFRVGAEVQPAEFAEFATAGSATL